MTFSSYVNCANLHITLLTTSTWSDLQFENHKGYIIHHHTMIPKEQRKYHLSTQHHSHFEYHNFFAVVSSKSFEEWCKCTSCQGEDSKGGNTHLYAYIPTSVSLKLQAHTSFKKHVGYSTSFTHHIMKPGN